MITEQITCDICGKQKGEVNHWWMIADNEKSFTVLPWTKGVLPDYSHVCGQECASTFLSCWMAEHSK